MCSQLTGLCNPFKGTEPMNGLIKTCLETVSAMFGPNLGVPDVSSWLYTFDVESDSAVRTCQTLQENDTK